MIDKLKSACIQINSGPDIQANLDMSAELIHAAAANGARLVCTPELTDRVVSNLAEKIDGVATEDVHPALPFFSELANKQGISLLIGSIIVKIDDHKIANRSYLFGPDGKIKASYDKIHLYDVDLPSGESHRESRIFVPGDRAVLGDIGPAKIGMSICYDVRFPHLYRSLSKAGAQILSAPAAFTVPTGKAHWEVLLRARAIENGTFVLAPAQCGGHEGARMTYGHSMIVNPWGEIIAQMEDEIGFIEADLNLAEVASARRAIPALQHDRAFEIT